MPVNLLNAQILLIRHLLGVPARPMTNYMDGIEKTPNRAILKGRLSGQPFCVPAFQSCMVTDGNIREQPLSRKGRRLFYTLYLSPRFSRAGKNSNFQF